MEDVMKELLMLRGFPEVYHLIKVTLTISVTSATAKRSFSVLKKVKNIHESHHGAGKTDSSCSVICRKRTV